MSNPYYTRANLVSHALGRSGVVNAQLQAIEEGFDEVYNDVASLGEGTASTSMTIGTGNKSFTAGTGRFQIGQFLTIASTLSPQNLMFGEVIAANQTTGAYTVNVIYTTGSGTFSAWTLALSSPGLLAFTPVSIDTLTNKTISVDDNTINGLAASSFALTDGTGKLDGAAAQKAIPAGAVVGTSDAQTLTNKTFTYSGNSPSGFQPTLVSGTSIKTVNGSTLLGSGDLTVDTAASLVATGTIGSNVAVSLRTDGTVEATTGTYSATGTRAAIDANATWHAAACYDATTGKVVVAYEHQATGLLYCAVGTVSGSTISFGTPVSTGHNTADAPRICAVGSSKVIVAYRQAGDNNTHSYIVGTISGTTISYGTAAAVGSSFGGATTNGLVEVCWNSTNSVAIFAAYDYNSNLICTIAATLSGTVLTFGSAVTLATGITAYNGLMPALAWDSVTNKFIVVLAGRAVLGTSSGTTITLGTLTAFGGALAASTNSVAAITAVGGGKVAIAYSANSGMATTLIVADISASLPTFGTPVTLGAGQNYTVSVAWSTTTNIGIVIWSNTSDNYGKSRHFTVSGTDISVEPEVTWRSASIHTGAQSAGVTWDGTNNKFVIGFKDGGNSNYASAQPMLITGVTSTNADKFIGFAHGSATNGQSIRVAVTYQVDANRSGLTARTNYWMDATGAFSTLRTAYPRAGFALNATKIIVGAEG